MGDVFHLLEVVLDQADMRSIAASHAEADELRVEWKIVRPHNGAMLAGESVGAEAWWHEPIDDRGTGVGQRDVARRGMEHVGQHAACMPWAIRPAELDERAKACSVATGPCRRLGAEVCRRGRECRSEDGVAIGSTLTATQRQPAQLVPSRS